MRSNICNRGCLACNGANRSAHSFYEIHHGARVGSTRPSLVDLLKISVDNVRHGDANRCHDSHFEMTPGK
jgi:hypothetical protein